MATPASLVRTAHPLSARPAALGRWWRPGAALRVAGRLLMVAAGLLVVWLMVAPAAMAEVAPTGAFQTSVAIRVPPFHGLEPRLGLAYSSSGSNGWIGAGWSLTGLSTIQRRSTDRGIPRWDATDRFVLDGQDLLACPAKDPTEDDDSRLARSPSCAHRLDDPRLAAYTTRVESFQRIAAEGDPYQPSNATRINDCAGSGGARWLVWRTDGVKATYQPGLCTSRGVLEWRLTRVEDLNLHKDPNGDVVANVVSYEWADPQGAQVSVLKRIRYGDVEIRFQSEGRGDPVIVATGAGLVENATRLRAIQECAGENLAPGEECPPGSLIRGYALRYRDDPDRPARQSFLQSVQQYGSEGPNGPRLPATTFTAPQASPDGWRPRPPVPVANWAADWPAGPDDSARFAVTLNGGSQGEVAWQKRS